MLELPKKFDFSKIKVLGGYSLELKTENKKYGSGSFGSMDVFLFRYGRDIVYVPNISLKEIKKLCLELFELIKEWLPFQVYSDELELGIGTIYHSRMRKLLPDYNFENKKSRLYNIFTYKNKRDKKGYYLGYGLNDLGEKTDLGVGLYNKEGELINTNITTFCFCRYVSYQKANSHIIVDTQTNRQMKTNELDEVIEITEDYIVGVTIKDNYENYICYYKVIRKSDNKVVYRDIKGDYYDGAGYSGRYKLIANRYLALYSFSKGILDLKTGERIEYPFKNVCENFICNVTDKEFTDRKGTHNLSELPDLSWTGYNTLEFIEKFGGFVPDKYKVGSLSLIHTGGYETYRKSVLIFKGLENGFFFKKKDKVVDLISKKEFKIDNTMLSWINNNDNLYLFDKKPKDISKFSVLEALEKGKEVKGLCLSNGYLYKNRSKLKTNFMREEVFFRKSNIRKSNIVDVLLVTEGDSIKFEIVCSIQEKEITFETNENFEKFDIANIA